MTATAQPLVIDKGIPIPPKNNRKSGLTATLRAMESGDSTLIQAETSNNIHTLAKAAGIPIVVRKEAKGAYRVWRIA